MSTQSPPLPHDLVVLLGGKVAGVVDRAAVGAPLVFTYDETWRSHTDAYPLSLSLPLAGRQYVGEPVTFYMKGLLSDDPARLKQTAARYGVSPNDPFALLAHIGEDCPGAVQFARPDRLDALVNASPGEVKWLNDDDVVAQIRSLRAQNANALEPADEGQFSLPGALAKVALRWDSQERRWGQPSGRVASTHILKPPRGQIPFNCENEHLCLELARELGINAASSYVLQVADEKALVVKRYDRLVSGNTVERIHQEDMSQALGVDPDLKYANQGAPTIADIVQILREWSTNGLDDAHRFLRAVALNWVIAGTDAHPRNYSVLIRPGSDVILAPLYDIASALFLISGQARVAAENWNLAMAVDGEVRIGQITGASWAAQAKASGLQRTRVLEDVRQLLDAVPEAVKRVTERGAEVGIDAPFARKFMDGINGEVSKRLAALR